MALIPVKQDPRTGATIMWQDNTTGRYYMVNQTGQTIEVDQYGRPLQQHMQQQPYQQPYQQQQQYQQPYQQPSPYGGYGNPYYNQQVNRYQPQQAATGISASIGNGFGRPGPYGAAGQNVAAPASYKDKASRPIPPQPQPQQVQQPNKACNTNPVAKKQVISLIDFKPEIGSELEPLIDEEKFGLDININDTTREYKFIMLKKEGRNE